MSARTLALLLAGATIAFVGAILGIGGGLFAVPLLHYAFRLPLRAAVATSLTLVFATALSSTVSEALHADGALHASVVLPLIGGALVGAQFGYLASRRLPEVGLKAVFAVVLMVVGVRLLWFPSAPAAPASALAALALGDVLKVALVGLCAGTVAPLLGIGGGLIVVPGLIFVVPAAGYLGARAAALAMAVVTSSRSVHLYAREGSVDRRVVPWFAGGALAGAVLGVQVAHLDGAERVGQALLGTILVVTALRFGLDVSRRARRRPAAEAADEAAGPARRSA